MFHYDERGRLKYVAKNEQTGDIREGTVSERMAERAVMDGIDLCTGRCQCRVEADGSCPNGWPSRLQAAGVC